MGKQHKQYNIFVASSMKNSQRNKVNAAINKANDTLRIRNVGVSFNALVYSENPINDALCNTQLILDNKAATYDIFLLLVDNNNRIGEYTIEEYSVAQQQASRSSNKYPYIKAFVFTTRDQEPIDVTYTNKCGTDENFEKRLSDDSGRYLHSIRQELFEDFFVEWLIAIAYEGFENNHTQNELSYGKHIEDIKQSDIRNYNKRYYRREKFDGEIERILESSPIVILEGNTYSGKTRAAYELMTHREEWEKHTFHIYNSNHCLDHLNNIRLNLTDLNPGDVYLLDDINDIIKGEEIRERVDASLWSELNKRQFDKKSWGNTRIIITVSGKLSSPERTRLYQQLFNAKSVSREFLSMLESITVNFDQYDRRSFKEMVDAMVRDGIIGTNEVRPGNYTIGSLFIKHEDINEYAKNIYNEDSLLLKSIVGHYRYANNSKFTGNIEEIADLYSYLKDNKYPHLNNSVPNNDEKRAKSFLEYIEMFRKDGILTIVERDGSIPKKVAFDNFILESFEEQCISNSDKAKELNEDLIDYAYYRECKQDKGKLFIFSVEQMAYMLVDRNNLEDDQTVALIERVAMKRIANFAPGSTKLAMQLILISNSPDRYPVVFCSTAISKLRDFERLEKMLNHMMKCIEKNKKPELLDSITSLYKHTLFSALSLSNRKLTMTQQRSILSHILDANKECVKPFREEDFNDVFSLSRISPFIKQDCCDIIRLASNATMEGFDLNFGGSVSDVDDDYDDYDEDEDEDEDNNDNQNNDNETTEGVGYTSYLSNDILYNKIYLVQLSKVIIAAFNKVDSYDEFKDAVGTLQSCCCTSPNLMEAVTKTLPIPFYKSLSTIAKRLSFEDRLLLFDYVLNIDDRRGPFNNTTCPAESIEFFRRHRIMAMNQLLERLDENDAVQSYYRMISLNLYDLRTCSHLLNNELVNFEQALYIVSDGGNQKNFITLNQLMKKAETTTDANACLRLMGIADNDTTKLRDEYAFSQYLAIKSIDQKRCIELVKAWRKAHPGRTLSEVILNIILRKFSLKQLIDIFFPDKTNSGAGYYMQTYGLADAEIAAARNNSILINILFLRAGGDEQTLEISKLIEQRFEDMMKDEKQRKLIIDPDHNANNSILSVYLKNRLIFSDYDSMKRELDSICTTYGATIRKTEHLYSPLLWQIKQLYKDEKCCRESAIKQVNEILIEAYNYFTEYYDYSQVVKMIASLYQYRIALVEEGDFDTKQPYAYEGQTMEFTFKEYLNHLLKKSPAYADGTFIYFALTTMQSHVNHDIYEQLAAIAQYNHDGVKYDSIYKPNKDTTALSKPVRELLLSYNRKTKSIQLDRRLVYNVSIIKVLWWLMSNDRMTFDQAEKYRIENNIPITQTYLNIVFKSLDMTSNKQWNKSHKGEILDEYYDKMVDYMNSSLGSNNVLHKSIQMCISLISTSSSVGRLERIFNALGFGQYRSHTEVIGAYLNQLLRLRYKTMLAHKTMDEFQYYIRNYKSAINIHIINCYLHMLVKISKKELMYDSQKEPIINVRAIFARCWDTLLDERKIDVNKLLGTCGEQEWKIEANVQTFSYFADLCPTLISTMNSWFDGDFTYDDNKKKSCLKDALKNYSYCYERKYSQLPESDKELDRIADIAIRSKNVAVLDEILKEYIFKSYEGPKGLRVTNLLWLELLKRDSIKNRAAYIFYTLVHNIDDAIGRGERYHIPIFKEDTTRCMQLRELLAFDKLDVRTQEHLKSTYAKLKSAPAKEMFALIYDFNEA